MPNPYLDIFANHGDCPVETPPPTTPQTVTIYAAGTPGNDGTYPTMELRINDKVVATFTDVQGDPAQRDFQAFTFTNNYWPVDVTTVKVAFVNDSGPRNLYVDKIVVGGVIYESEAPTTYSTGTYSGTGCDDDYKQSEVLHCNGYFQYSVRVQRTNYSLAGQAIGLRIVGSPDGNNGLYYMHTDHLGSTSTLSILQDDGTAPRVYDSRAYYEPFGEYRLEPTGEYTDRGYTGHLGNNSGSNDIGLIYMNARYYVPGVARFASADTIVPAPNNPQQFNRYSYALGNPLNFTDPTGHCSRPGQCLVDGAGGNGLTVSFSGMRTAQVALAAGLTWAGITYAYQNPDAMWDMHDLRHAMQLGQQLTNSLANEGARFVNSIKGPYNPRPETVGRGSASHPSLREIPANRRPLEWQTPAAPGGPNFPGDPNANPGDPWKQMLSYCKQGSFHLVGCGLTVTAAGGWLFERLIDPLVTNEESPEQQVQPTSAQGQIQGPQLPAGYYPQPSSSYLPTSSQPQNLPVCLPGKPC